MTYYFKFQEDKDDASMAFWRESTHGTWVFEETLTSVMSGSKLNTLVIPDTLRSDVFLTVFKTVIMSVICEFINEN